MASSNFDELTRALAVSTSRRETLKALFASFLACMPGLGHFDPIRAANICPKTGCGSTQDTDILWQTARDCVNNQKGCTLIDPGKQWVVTLDTPKNLRTNYLLIAGRRITGIECAVIWQNTNPDYWALAWQEAANRFLQKMISQEKIGMAINSKGTRQHCQLHIHVSCVQQAVKSLLVNNDNNIPPNPAHWFVSPTLQLPVTSGTSRDFRVFHTTTLHPGNQNLFQVLESTLRSVGRPASDMEYQTLVVVQRPKAKGGGFYILNSEEPTSPRTNLSHGIGAGEQLLNEVCS